MTPSVWLALGIGLAAPLVPACGSDGDGGIDIDAAASACVLTEHTSATNVINPDGCAVLERDTSACDAARNAAGLSSVWLHFSCRVTLTATSTTITAVADGQPDYLSNYFASDNPCHENYTGAIQNPNTISAQSYTLNFPLVPTASPASMRGTAVVGLALNGVPIYGNFAAPGDDIFEEADTFDRCGAHPQQQGRYHYHAEPYSISYDDSAFIGVMRDGYAIYGRRDSDGSLPALDNTGGHTGTTPDSSTPVFHYHVNLQTSTNTGTAGEQQWFLTTGQYAGTPGSCSGC